MRSFLKERANEMSASEPVGDSSVDVVCAASGPARAARTAPGAARTTYGTTSAAALAFAPAPAPANSGVVSASAHAHVPASVPASAPAPTPASARAPAPAKMAVEHLNLFYGDFQGLRDINLAFPENQVTALIGPSGCGKSTLLKTLNRMNDLVEGCRVEGSVTLDGTDAYRSLDPTDLRRRLRRRSFWVIGSP